MEPLTLDDLRTDADAFDAAVAATPGVDDFCSRSAWALSVRDTWAADEPVVAWRGAAGYAAFVRLAEPASPRILAPLDVMWRFSAPFAGPDPGRLAAELARTAGWDAAFLSGLAADSPTFRAVLAALDGYRLHAGPAHRRWRADLAGGAAGFLDRRSPKLRRGLREAQRRAGREGVRFVAARADADALLARMLAVEARSWKGPQATGLCADDMRAFYRRVFARLEATGALRATFAQLDGETIGYIAGGVTGDLYRGLQFSYDARFRRLSVGHLLQFAQIEAAAAEGVRTYDLGMDLPYKRRWADGPFDTATIIVTNR